MLIFAISTIQISNSHAQDSTENHIAKITYVEETVRLQKEGSEGWLNITGEYEIGISDLLKTGEHSKAEIEFINDAVFRLSSETSVKFDSFDNNNKQLTFSIEAGDIWINAANTNSDKTVKIISPVSEVSTEQSVLRMSVGSDGTTEIKVYDGEILVSKRAREISDSPEDIKHDESDSNIEDIWNEKIGASQKMIITSNGKIAFKGNFSSDEIDEQTDWVSWNLDRSLIE